MSQNLTYFQNTLKKFGKIIFISAMTPPMIQDLKKAHMGLTDQVASGLAEEFDLNQEVVTALGSNVKSINDTLAKLPAQCKVAAQTYLNKYVAVDLGLIASPALSSLQTELTSQMNTAGATVAPSGTIWTYFNSNLGINLPMAVNSGAATIPDTYVDDDPI